MSYHGNVYEIVGSNSFRISFINPRSKNMHFFHSSQFSFAHGIGANLLPPAIWISIHNVVHLNCGVTGAP